MWPVFFYTGSNNWSWFVNTCARCIIINVMKSNPTAVEQEQTEVPSFRGPHSIILWRKLKQVDRTPGIDSYMCRNVDTLNIQHPSWWQNTSTIIQYTKKDRSLSRESCKLYWEWKLQCFLFPDRLFAIRKSMQSFSAICQGCQNWRETLYRQSHDPLSVES